MKKVFKSLYALIPFKRQLFTLIRKIFHPEEKIYRHLYFKGVFKVPVKGNISFHIFHYGYQVENDIFWKGLTGRWEKKSIDLWMKLSEKASVVIDIGANTGVYSLISKSINKRARVIAIEPIDRVFKKLERNTRVNGFDIENQLLALSDHDGETVFHDTDEEHTYTASISKRPPEGSHYHPVKAKIATMDSLVNEKNLDRVDLVKIDVEYHEPEVIKGFSMIGRYHPSILIEILSDDIGCRVQEEIENHGASYLYFDIDEESGIRKVDKIRKSSGMNYLLCTEQVAKELQLI